MLHFTGEEIEALKDQREKDGWRLGQQDWGWVDTKASNRARWGLNTRITHRGERDTSTWHLEVLRASLPDGILEVLHYQDRKSVLVRTLHLEVTETHSSWLSQQQSLLHRPRGTAA